MQMRSTISLFMFASLALPLLAQPGGGAPPVRYTEAIRQDVRVVVKVSGQVESRRSSTVASELSGVVASVEAREGETVRRGAPLVRLRSDNVELRLRAARGELREAKARLDLARQSRARAERMFEEKILSQQRLDDAVSESEAWLGRVAQLEADVSRLESDLAKTVVRAPFTGIVTEERTAPGEWVSVGGEVVELIDTVNLEVTVDVPERYFSGVRKGTPATVRIPSLGGAEIRGEVAAVVPRASSGARSFPVKISFASSETSVAVGMMAEASIPIGAAQPKTLVPKDATVRQGGRIGVWTVGTDQIVQWVEVQTGASVGAWIEVSGVEPGARVITRGNERLRPGQTVKPTSQEYPRP